MSDENLPHLTTDDVRLNYHSNYYDYARSGQLTWNGQRYWFTELAEEGSFELIQLTDEQWAHEDAKHAAFQHQVGTHCDYWYDDEGKHHRPIGDTNPDRDGWMNFYNDPRWKQDRDFSNNLRAAVWVRFVRCIACDGCGELPPYGEDDECPECEGAGRLYTAKSASAASSVDKASNLEAFPGLVVGDTEPNPDGKRHR